MAHKVTIRRPQNARPARRIDEMATIAVVLAVLGIAVGICFRLRMLLPILALLFLFSVVASLAWELSFAQTALAVLAVQAIVQTGYFVGLMIRGVVTSTYRIRPIL
jgi:hypothetical protein